MRTNLLILLFLPTWGIAQEDLYRDSIRHFRELWWQDMLADPRAPIDSTDLSHLDWYEPNPVYRVSCTLERLTDAQVQDIPTYSGITKRFKPYGILRFSLQGQSMQLIVFQSFANPAMAALDPHLFLPFKDRTTGEATYGGGRYLDLSKAECATSPFLLDFNKAYNPWCAYSAGYNCPIPPLENYLDIAVTAGERNYLGPYKESK